MTVNSLTPVSLDPPLLLFCASLSSATAKRIVAVGAFSVNVLSADQQDVSMHHAGRPLPKPTWRWRESKRIPWIEGANATFRCRLVAEHPGGDHRILIGGIDEMFGPATAATPLLYHGGKYARLGVASACSEECIRIMRSRVSSGNQQAQINDKIAQVDAGGSAASMSLLRDFLINETAAIEERIGRAGVLAPEERGLSRTKVAIASRQALSSAQRLFAELGGSLLPEGTRIERLFRDIHAMSSHFLLQPEPISEAYGRLLLGLEPAPGTRL
jgi:3-hydroxy-9,10-secoandrosta-1,3,5(10)-triene-9,17-dione monooxygenase reductase component